MLNIVTHIFTLRIPLWIRDMSHTKSYQMQLSINYGYGGGETYIVIPYLVSSPIRIVTSHQNPTAYVFYIAGQEELPLATITHVNNHFQWTVTGM